jgi:hypothetical protein
MCSNNLVQDRRTDQKTDPGKGIHRRTPNVFFNKSKQAAGAVVDGPEAGPTPFASFSFEAGGGEPRAS